MVVLGLAEVGAGDAEDLDGLRLLGGGGTSRSVVAEVLGDGSEGMTITGLAVLWFVIIAGEGVVGVLRGLVFSLPGVAVDSEPNIILEM